jgi:hypothetical protein
MDNVTTLTAIITLLKRYLLTGIPDCVIALKSALKFCNVGCLTNIRGGKANNSLYGLKAFENIKINGIDINAANGTRKK